MPWANGAPSSALRGMIAEFTFFMGIAAVCFSGLLFTLWTLGNDTVSLEWSWPLTGCISCTQMDGREDRLAHDSDLVRQYIFVLRSR